MQNESRWFVIMQNKIQYPSQRGRREIGVYAPKTRQGEGSKREINKSPVFYIFKTFVALANGSLERSRLGVLEKKPHSNNLFEPTGF